MSVKVNIVEGLDGDAMLAQIELAMRRTVAKRAVKAAGTVVKRAAKKEAPRSTQTGTRLLWSAKTKAERAGVKPHYQTIAEVTRDYGETFVAVVGGAYPAGALDHLIQLGHKLVAWGRPTNLFVSGNPFLERAADATLSEQKAAFTDTIQRAIAKEAK